ncbi:MAG: ABC transporter substrate-binding protein, partial [Hyphomicrobiales bacterium]
MKPRLLVFATTLAMCLAAPAAFADEPKQGGSAVITYNNDLTTLDPQVGYDWQNWSVIKSIFDGLMD